MHYEDPLEAKAIICVYRTIECIRTTTRKARNIPIGCLGMKPKISQTTPLVAVIEHCWRVRKQAKLCGPLLAAVEICIRPSIVNMAPLLLPKNEFTRLLE
jgi:hypothetical protein